MDSQCIYAIVLWLMFSVNVNHAASIKNSTTTTTTRTTHKCPSNSPDGSTTPTSHSEGGMPAWLTPPVISIISVFGMFIIGMILSHVLMVCQYCSFLSKAKSWFSEIPNPMEYLTAVANPNGEVRSPVADPETNYQNNYQFDRDFKPGRQLNNVYNSLS